MINQLTNEIIEELGSQYSKGIIRHGQYSRLSDKNLKIITSNFGLKKELLKFIECSGCGEEVKVNKKDDGTKIAHCQSADCRKIITVTNEDLAYSSSISGIGEFLIKILNIKSEVRPIESGSILYLGKVELKEVSGLIFDVYLAKNIQNKDSLELCKPSSKKIPSLIINLSRKKFKLPEVTNIASCCFGDLISYHGDLKKYLVNYKNILDAIAGSFSGLQKSTVQGHLNKKCEEWLEQMVKCKAIKNGDKPQLLQFAQDHFNVTKNSFMELRRKIIPMELRVGGRPSEK